MKRILSLAAFLLFDLDLIAQVQIVYPKDLRGIEIGLSKVKVALLANGYTLADEATQTKNIKYRISLQVDPGNKKLKPEGYEIQNKGSEIALQTAGPSGARYGALALAEELAMKKDLNRITTVRYNPPLDVRAIKFNLPWEPYRESKSMQYHLSACRDLKFWEAFLNMMFENRFNLLALYNMHPFPYLVKLEKYPEACPFSDQEMEDWNAFWKNLFRMAKDRGIDVFIVNWNIVVPQSFAEKHHVKVLNDTSAVVIDYTRESIRQVINEYEDLGGIGVTLADWMNNMTAAQRENWIASTFIKAIHEASRTTRFMHRSVLSGSPLEMRRIIDEAKLPGLVEVEVKFNWSHGHSTPHLALTHDNTSGAIDRGFWDPEPVNFKIQWMIRNEDFWILRWGEPDFIRQHIQTNAKSYVNGYHIGSEGYIPAFDYFTRASVGKTWHYAFERQWLFYSLWGRLLYDINTPDKVFEEMFSRKYPLSNGRQMLVAFRTASRMPLRLASYFAATWDYTLYAEGFMAPHLPAGGYGYDDHISPFISIDELIDRKVLDPKYISIKDYVSLISAGKTIPENLAGPLRLAEELHINADSALRSVTSLRKAASQYTAAYNQELDDIQTWALLSRYFAFKLDAGVALESYRKKGMTADKERALYLLENCRQVWGEISSITDTNYLEVPYFKSNSQKDNPEADNFSWRKMIPQVERDIQIARQAQVKK